MRSSGRVFRRRARESNGAVTLHAGRSAREATWPPVRTDGATGAEEAITQLWHASRGTSARALAQDFDARLVPAPNRPTSMAGSLSATDSTRARAGGASSPSTATVSPDVQSPRVAPRPSLFGTACSSGVGQRLLFDP
jgi:hypothetical protein